ncbi:MAG: AI-2E family transporter, partial [Pseudomonadota bacterium]|nr:AI-2E family transporter [Pseudomonadota bacterium]
MSDSDASGRDGTQNGSDAIGTSPSRISDPRIREEVTRAFVWVGVIGLVVLALYISRSLLVVFGALVFAAMIDGGARLLGRILPIARGWRVALVLVSLTLFFIWLAYFAGATISEEAAMFPELIQRQIADVLEWAQAQGIQIDQ